MSNKTKPIATRLSDDDFLEAVINAKALGKKDSEYFRDAVIWYNSLHAEDPLENIKNAQEMEHLRTEKMKLENEEKLTKQIRREKALERMVENIKTSPHPISSIAEEAKWKNIHSKVKFLNSILQIESFYTYAQDERFHPRLERFKDTLQKMGTTVPECLKAVQEVPQLVKDGIVQISKENGGATYKVTMIDTRRVGR